MNFYKLFAICKRYIPIIFAVSCFVSCDENTTNPEDEFNVVSISPSNSESNVSVTSSITIVFSNSVDTSTVSLSTIQISDLTGGYFAFTNENKTVTYNPAGNLNYSKSYSVSVKTGIKNTSGKNLQKEFNSSFSTGQSQIPQVNYPLAKDTKWMYHNKVNSTGNLYECDIIFYVADDAKNIGGKTASEIKSIRLSEYGVSSFSDMYLSNDQNNLWKWDDSLQWMKIVGPDMSTSSMDIEWFFALDAKHYSTITPSVGNVTVPAGTFNSLKLYHHYDNYGGSYNPEDVSETIYESHSDGVGLVLSSYSYSYDDNDPQGFDWSYTDTYELTGFNSVSVPSIYTEIEPNHGGIHQNLELPAALKGNVSPNDPGDIVTWNFVTQNPNGQRIIQDLYLFNSATNTTVDFYYQLWWDNKLEIYIMKLTGNQVSLVAKRTASGSETLNLSMNTTYLIGIQALTPYVYNDYTICIK